MVTVLTVVVIVLSLVVAGLIYMNASIKDQLELIDREQHIQNEDILKLIKSHINLQDCTKQHQEMLLQHIEVLKYLVEQDPKLNAGKMYFTGPMGEA